MPRVLLFAMPDSVSAFDGVMDLPNLGLCSLAGNLRDCHTRIVDLVMPKRRVGRVIEAELSRFRPDVVGISAMTYQYPSARTTARLVRRWRPDLPIVLGGYHATLLPEEVATEDGDLFDVIVRTEGERSFGRLVRALQRRGEGLEEIPGISHRTAAGEWQHNPCGPPLDLSTIELPDRSTRAYPGFKFMGRRFDCAETSRGCVMPCSFCSITKMYGKTFRAFEPERVVEDLRRLQADGVRGVLFVDDNITLDVRRLRVLCEALQVAGLHRRMELILQATVEGIASSDDLAALLHRAGVRLIFMGIESESGDRLRALGKRRASGKTERAIRLLREAGIIVVGGFIVGAPDDDARSIRETFRWIREVGVDHGIVQCLTPYPGTRQREELEAAGLITHPRDYQRYNGFMPNVRTHHLSSEELGREMWRAGVSLYFRPSYNTASRMMRRYHAAVPRLLLNNVRFLVGGARGRLFASSHSF